MATIDDIQNSEKLLDLSNQLINSINERKKLLKGINAEEQLFFTTVKQQQKLSQDITANAEKYLGYQIKSKDLAKQIKAVEDNRKKNSDAFTKGINNQLSLEQKLKKEKQDSLKKAFELDTQILAKKKEINDLDEKNQNLEFSKQNQLRVGNFSLAKQMQEQIRENQRIANSKEKEIKTFQTELQKRKDIFKATAETIKNAKEALKSQEKEIAFLTGSLATKTSTVTAPRKFKNGPGLKPSQA
jgi:chromosome segregation ATPase